MIDYKQKYLKYKQKYLELKELEGGDFDNKNTQYLIKKEDGTYRFKQKITEVYKTSDIILKPNHLYTFIFEDGKVKGGKYLHRDGLTTTLVFEAHNNKLNPTVDKIKNILPIVIKTLYKIIHKDQGTEKTENVYISSIGYQGYTRFITCSRNINLTENFNILFENIQSISLA